MVQEVPPRHRSSRGKARKRAVDLVYAAEARGEDPRAGLKRAHEAAGRRGGVPVHEHTERLVAGVVAHRAHLERVVAGLATGWDLDRMPAVDRAVLLVGAYELLGCPDVPPGVALSEAADLADDLSTPESARFVNGVLARVVADAEPLPAA